MHEHELKSIGLDVAQRAVNAGGELLPIATPFYSGGYSYTHVLRTVRGKLYRVARTIAVGIRLPLSKSLHGTPELALDAPSASNQAPFEPSDEQTQRTSRA